MAAVTRPGLALACAIACACGPHPAAPRPAPAKLVQTNQPGEVVELSRVLEPGYVTIVDFWATWCGGCKVAEARFTAAIADDPHVVVRKIDVGDGQTPVARQYKVGALPHVRVFDRAGNLRYVLVGNDALTAGDAAETLSHEK